MALDRVKKLFSIGTDDPTTADDVPEDPQLGFKVLYYPERKAIGVRVIAARNLPTAFGSIKPKGYLIKVKVFPGKEKFETQMLPSQAPCFDEHFLFADVGVANLGQTAGRFVTFTVYADLDGTSASKRNSNGRPPLKKSLSFREKIESIIVGPGPNNSNNNNNNEVQLRPKRTGSRSDRFTLNSRRTVGAVSFNLDRSVFTERGKGGAYYTPDIWRNITEIGSGRVVQPRESKKGSLEVTMKYSNSEDGRNDMLHVSLSKFRCSMATMEEHEKLGGNLYLKMATHEYDVVVSKWKGDTFAPTISMRIEPSSATMITTFNNYNLARTRVVIKLKCRNALQQKRELGAIIVHAGSELFRAIVDTPTMPVTRMLDFA